jgi:hypothetical protein
MRANLLVGWIGLAAAASCLAAAPIINVGTYTLSADTSGQTILLSVSGSDLVTGFNLRAQLGDGTGPGVEPVFQAVSFTGGIWDANAITVMGGPVSGALQFAQASVVFNTNVSVAANGYLVTLTLDTTGLFSGSYALLLKGTQIGADSDFIVSGGGILSPSITNGTINVVATSTAWKATSGNWSDPNCWTAGEPNQSLSANITNGGTVTINQAGERCSTLTLGPSLGQSGAVSMTGGALSAGAVYVGSAGRGVFTQSGGTHTVSGSLYAGYTPDGNGTYLLTRGDLIAPYVYVGEKGRGTFTQSDGNHYVQQELSIATEGNSVGAYNLQGGTLLAGRIDVGGSPSGRGGAGAFAVSGGHAVLSGKLVVWSGSTASLGLGTVVGADGNRPAVDLSNDGTLTVGDANGLAVTYCLGDVTGNGNIVIGPGATLWAASMTQNLVQVEAGGTLELAAQNPHLYATMARANYDLAVPEPATLAMMILGALAAVGRRKRRT